MVLKSTEPYPNPLRNEAQDSWKGDQTNGVNGQLRYESMHFLVPQRWIMVHNLSHVEYSSNNAGEKKGQVELQCINGKE